LTGPLQPPGADVIVVGAGLAGLTAALRLAEAGLRVVTIAKGHGSIRLAPATIDILGYAPGLVSSPAAALPGFVADHPGHPYARVDTDLLAQSVAWFTERAGDLAYTGDGSANMMLPTALGVARPSAVAPEPLAAGDLRSLRRVAICGLRVLKDFHPALVADNLRAAAVPGIEARAVMVSAPTDEADLSPLALARRFEEPGFRQAVAAALRAVLRDEEAVGLPAVLGVGRARAVRAELQEAVGRPVFEIATIPPSVPGIRLAEALTRRLRRAGGRIVLGAEAAGAQVRGGRLTGLRVRAAGRESVRPARWVVLASGGLASGGLAADSAGQLRESVLGLPVGGVPADGTPPFRPRYLDEHPMSAAGLQVDSRLRPAGPDGEPVLENVLAAGAVIGGARPWREKSGDGISLSTGYLAAGTILEETAR